MRDERRSRPDPSFSYTGGIRWESTRRLKKIAMWAPNLSATQRVWEYTLSYEMGLLGRSLLSSVQKCGHQGTCLWPKRLRWMHENTLLFADGPELSIPSALTSLRVFDVNGDGRDDILRAKDVPRPPVLHSPGSGWPHMPTTRPKPSDELHLHLSEPGSELSFRRIHVNPEDSPLEHVNLAHSRPVDADGDGKVELLAYHTERCEYRLYAWDEDADTFVPTGDRLSPGERWGCSGDFYAKAPGLELVDLDGDALLDVLSEVELDSGSFWHIRMNAGGSFGEPVGTGVRAGPDRCDHAIGGDLDGDGRGELIVGEGSDCGTSVAIHLDDEGELTTGPALPLKRGDTPAKLADLNGDGLRDALWIHAGTIEISMNTGNGFRPAVPLPDPELAGVLDMIARMDEPDRAVIEPFDLNRDGRDDLLVSIPDWLTATPSEPVTMDRIIALLSSGDGSFSRVDIGWEEPDTGTTDAPIPAGDAMWNGDFDGDGRADVLTWKGTSLQVTLASGHDVDLLSSVSDGDDPMSLRAQVRYGRTDPASSELASCTYPQRCVRRGAPVVVWAGGLERPGGTYYRFDDLRTDLLGRGSLGFGRMTEWSSAWPLERITSFDHATRVGTTYPYASRPRSIREIRPIVDHGPLGARDCVAEIDGSCTLEEGPARASARVVQQEMEYRVRSLNGGRSTFVYTRRIERREYEDPEVDIRWDDEVSGHCLGVDDPGSGAPIQRSAMYEVDDHGNLLREAVETRGGLRREVTRTFEVRREEWLVGLIQTQAERTYEAGTTAPAKLHTAYHHDERGLLDEVRIEPDSEDADIRETISFAYDEAGRLRQQKRDAAGESSRLWNYEYDDVSGEGIFVSQMWNGLGVSQWMYTHPAYGVLMGEIDANGARSTRIHDDLGRVKGATSGAGPVSEIRMAAREEAGKTAGLVVEATLAGGGRAVATMDERGLVVEQALRALDGRMRVRRSTHDLFGRPLWVSRPGFGAAAAEKAERTYDSLSRMVTERAPDGELQRYEHRLFETTRIDPEFRLTRTTVDVDGRPRETAVKVGDVWLSTAFVYGPNSKLTTVADPKGNKTELGYDLRGRRTSVSDPDAGTRITRYNGYGEIREEVDAQGRTAVVERDAMGRRRVVRNADGVTTFVWDIAPHGMGQLAAAVSPDGTKVTYTYDDRGRVAEVRTAIDDEEFAVGVTYTAAGLRDELLYPKVPGRERFRVKYVYEEGSLRELRASKEDGSTRPLWKVNARNEDGALLKAVFGNEVVAERVYDPVTGRLETVQARKTEALQALAYRYHDDGRVLERRDSVAGRVETFDYDEMGRLEGWDLAAPGGSRRTTYGYDEIGNLRTVSEDGFLAEENGYEATGRPHAVVSRDGVAFAYDAAGRLERSSAGLSIEYTAFDLPRRLMKEGRRWDFSYDAFGARVKKAQDGEETIYVGGLYERRTDASGTQRHVFRVGSPEGEVAQVVFAGPGEERTLYVHSDPLGSVGVVTDDAGKEVERLHYEPFGRRIDENGKALEPAEREVKHGFTGHRHDEELGLIDMGGRLYDPNLRRFLTPDPFVTDPTSGQSYNRYSYVMNDPVNHVDPTGWIWKQVKYDNGSDGWVEFDDVTGEPIGMIGEDIYVGAPPDEPPPPPGEGRQDFEQDWEAFLHEGEERFEQGGGASVGGDYTEPPRDTLNAVLEHGLRLSDLTGEKPMPGIVSGAMMDDPVIVPKFTWSIALTKDFYNALELRSLAWHAGNVGESFALEMRAAMDLLGLVGAVAIESGIGVAMALGVVLPGGAGRRGGAGSGEDSTGGARASGRRSRALACFDARNSWYCSGCRCNTNFDS
ncbi:uncharacterized protein SOCE26_054620 [Sorangium cellulosum]|uniref:Teneurin-like YD-shell domain-containing protein n=1 Tax=Sorangium cellulosum TaxID=56 RepID=A0A2L0EXI4_SORCE|nr:FG-GAP-like repeat-containing protein [Sorangium cellulosum]AUX44003.1 uncharacterized protein SOCE26_054620 [Sorangium cellulosum]